MRKSISLILAVFFIFSPFFIITNFSRTTVYADELYARVITDDTPFYQTETDTQPLFFLPYTYYVKILDWNENFTHVECYGEGNTAAIDGFVPTNALFQDGLKVDNPYVVLDLTTVNTAVLYQDASLSVQSQYIFANRSLHYYGSMQSDSGTIYFVSYNDRLGYVKESDVFPFSIPNHPNELTFLVPDQPEDTPKEPSTDAEDFFGIKVAIIICLVFAGVIALFIAVSKRPARGVAASFYDENDYE